MIYLTFRWVLLWFGFSFCTENCIGVPKKVYQSTFIWMLVVKDWVAFQGVNGSSIRIYGCMTKIPSRSSFAKKVEKS